MEILDYRNSFAFTTSAFDGQEDNTARMQLLSRCQIHDLENGTESEFFLGKACIGEHVYQDKIAQIPTSEVNVIFGYGMYKLLKKFASHEHDEVQVSRVEEKQRNFDGRYRYLTDQHFCLRKREGRVLETPQEIIRAMLAGDPMVGRTILPKVGRWEAFVEYPLTYMNVHPPISGFQIDEGPIVFPELTPETEKPIERLEMAFILYNRLDRAEFIVRSPTQISQSPAAVTLHYSKYLLLEVQTQIFALAS
ncbi:MAG: hypothetical protein HXY20_01745 [Acidobacteria bacterium]|nr:hypothetical protein [Acidobacteriota bacterium]